MKVCFLINTTVMGGGNISFINLIKGLSNAEIECYVIHPDKIIDKEFMERATPYIKKMYYANLKMYYHPHEKEKSEKLSLSNVKKHIKKSKIYNYYRMSKEDYEVSKIIKKIQPDIIHTNVGVIHVGYRIGKKLNIPHIWHLREYQTKDINFEIEPSKQKFIELLHDTNVITITKDIRKYFELQNYPNARVIYNGCFAQSETSLVFPKKKYFLCCSRIAPEKGFEDVIPAFAKIHRKYPEYKLLIAGFGDSAYIDKLKNIAQEMNCLNSIQFLGFKSDVKELMDNATALIVASRFEGFGRMTAEAAFRGCQVIGHNTGGTKEILEITGGFPYSDGSKGLEAAMKKVIHTDINVYKKLAVTAQDAAKQCFSNEQYVSNVLKFYDEVLQRKKRN